MIKNEIIIEKGQTASKLLIVRNLSSNLNDLFEIVDNPEADSIQKFFNADKKTVSKRKFKATLIIEFLD